MKLRHLVIPFLLLAVSLAVWFAIRPVQPPPLQPALKKDVSNGNYLPQTTGVAPLPAAATEAPRVSVKELPPSTVRATPVRPPPPPSILARTGNVGGGKTDKDTRQQVSKDLQRVKGLISKYRNTFGENPVGTNAEIMGALMGRNPTGAHIDPDHTDGEMLNGKGELIDRFGNPYFFHQISGQIMEIRSAGPDGILWSSDDQVVR